MKTYTEEQHQSLLEKAVEEKTNHINDLECVCANNTITITGLQNERDKLQAELAEGRKELMRQNDQICIHHNDNERYANKAVLGCPICLVNRFNEQQGTILSLTAEVQRLREALKQYISDLERTGGASLIILRQALSTLTPSSELLDEVVKVLQDSLSQPSQGVLFTAVEKALTKLTGKNSV